jgi:hypothetical protein
MRSSISAYSSILLSVHPHPLKWPPILGLFKSVTVTLAYFRHNRTQAEISESFDVSQSTISRAISAITPLIEEGLAGTTVPVCYMRASVLPAGVR